jgi:hypothetical protein
MPREPGPLELAERHVHAAVVGHRAIDPDAIAELVRHRHPLASADEVRRVVDGVRHRIAGLGAIQPLLDDPAVSEVMVNAPGRPVWVERAGRLTATDVVLDADAVALVVERITAPLGLRVDRTRPLLDARLADGSRVNIAVPPLAVDGPCITIRRFVARALPLTALCPPGVARLLAEAVHDRRNVLAVGGHRRRQDHPPQRPGRRGARLRAHRHRRGRRRARPRPPARRPARGPRLGGRRVQHLGRRGARPGAQRPPHAARPHRRR